MVDAATTRCGWPCARLESGGEVSPELMTEAARRALGAYDLALGERLARVALDAGGGIQAGLALASALARMGRQKEADRAFARIDTSGADDEDRGVGGHGMGRLPLHRAWTTTRGPRPCWPPPSTRSRTPSGGTGW